jgi:hypothetical protein
LTDTKIEGILDSNEINMDPVGKATARDMGCCRKMMETSCVGLSR